MSAVSTVHAACGAAPCNGWEGSAVCRDGPCREQVCLVAVPRGLQGEAMREARTGLPKLLLLLLWVRGWRPGLRMGTLREWGLCPHRHCGGRSALAQASRPGRGRGRAHGAPACQALPSGDCVLTCPCRAVDESAAFGGSVPGAAVGPKNEAVCAPAAGVSAASGAEIQMPVQAAVLRRRREDRESSAQLKTSSRALSARWETSPQPTRLRPPGVHSRRLMAALPSSQVRGACRSWCVARR